MAGMEQHEVTVVSNPVCGKMSDGACHMSGTSYGYKSGKYAANRKLGSLQAYGDYRL